MILIVSKYKIETWSFVNIRDDDDLVKIDSELCEQILQTICLFLNIFAFLSQNENSEFTF
jgi:hypothetical protein